MKQAIKGKRQKTKNRIVEEVLRNTLRALYRLQIEAQVRYGDKAMFFTASRIYSRLHLESSKIKDILTDYLSLAEKRGYVESIRLGTYFLSSAGGTESIAFGHRIKPDKISEIEKLLGINQQN